MSSQEGKKLETTLQTLGCEVVFIPSVSDLLKVKNRASNLSTQLISRSPVSLELQEVQNKFSAKNVLVTGAGGSIASEICSILVKYGVSKIVLFDVSEVAIYLIESKLKTILDQKMLI